MTTRRDFLQFLGIGGLVAAVHNVDALGVTVVEKKLIVPNAQCGSIKIYSGVPGRGTLLSVLEYSDPNQTSHASPITGLAIASGVANWARIDDSVYGTVDVQIGGKESAKDMTFDNTNFIVGGTVDINSLSLRWSVGRSSMRGPSRSIFINSSTVYRRSERS